MASLSEVTETGSLLPSISPIRRHRSDPMGQREWSILFVALAFTGLSAESDAARKQSCPLFASMDTYRWTPDDNAGAVRLVLKTSRCDAPNPRHIVRPVFRSRLYARCRTCASELEVQSWPSCVRSRSDVVGERRQGYFRHRRLSIRDVPALWFPGDQRLEVYTQRTTLLLFGRSLKQLRKVMRDIERVSTPKVMDMRNRGLRGASERTLKGRRGCDRRSGGA